MANECTNGTCNNSETYYKYGETCYEGVAGREIESEPTPRVKAIRSLYFETSSSVSMEFPYWYTRKWNELEGEIPIIRRAEALKAGFSHLSPSIFPGELLVMGKTNYLRGSFPMPWLSGSYFMSKEDEMYKDALEAGKLSADTVTKMGKGGGNVTESAGNIVSVAGKFGLRSEELPILLKTARSWKNRSVEDIGCKYEAMVPEHGEKSAIMRSVICMFDSGYTLPQGREVINYYYPLRYGLDGLIELCGEKMDEVAGYPGMDRLYFYKSVIISIEGIQAWILNHAKEAKRLAGIEKDETQKQEYLDIVEMLEWITHNPPRTFKEALQLTWIFHTSVLNEDCISGMSPGRLGQVLYPWWKNEMDNKTITREETLELLECMRMKYTELDCFASMGVVGGVLSGNTFNNLCVGGLDKDGQDAANDLELLILESGITCATPQPTLSLLYDEKTSEELLMKGVECTKTGTGYPAWVGNRTAMDFIINNYQPEGMTPEEARAWSIGGCLESSAGSWHSVKVGGKEYWIPGGAGTATSVGVHFIGLPKLLELVLFNGLDQRTGEQVFEPHGFALESYEEVVEALKKYFAETVRVLTLCNNVQHDAWRKITPPVINSFLKPDCLKDGKDIGQEGSRYNATFNVETCGTINLVNSLASMKKNVFNKKNFTLSELKDAINHNFGYKHANEIGSYSLVDQKKGEEAEKWAKLYKQCLDAPKYGNDDSCADDILVEWEEWFCEMCHDYTSIYGKPLYACQISVSTHGPMGAVTMATPDGRLSGTTFADASMSAYPGTDRNGPYALFNSATCWDHSKSQNTQLNMKIHPSAIKGREGSRKMLELIRAYMRKGGFHVQFNIVDSKMLKDAQANPDKYRGLMVRVAGFTQYWVELGKPIQDEVISRTEYEEIA